MDDKLIFGELNDNGGIKRDVFICAVSGKAIEAGDAMIVVPGTRRFYRVKAPINWNMRDEVRAELEARARALDIQMPPSSADEAAPKKSK